MTNEIVLQSGESAAIVVLHTDASMSHIKISVDNSGTWGVAIDPNPAIPYSVIQPEDDTAWKAKRVRLEGE